MDDYPYRPSVDQAETPSLRGSSAILLPAMWCIGCALSSSLWYAFLTCAKTTAQRFEWAVRCTEAINACIVSVASAVWLICRILDDESSSWSPLAAISASRVPFEELEWLPQLIEIMCGYFIFDTAYELVLPCVVGSSRLPDIPFMIHHLVGIVAHLLTIRYRHATVAAYAPYIYLAEGSTPFLHFSWMLNALECTDSFLFLVNGSIGAMMYLVFRVVLPPALLLHLIVNKSSLS